MQSSALRIAFTSASGIRFQSKSRCDPIGPFSGVASAELAWPSRSTSAWARARSSAPKSSVSSRSSRRPRSARTGMVSVRVSSSIRSSRREGRGRGTKGGGSPCARASGEGDITIWNRSTPEAPSIMQWWIFVIIAKRSPSRPSTIQVSQSGRRRSSGCDMMRAESRFSCAALPGFGSAVWRRW